MYSSILLAHRIIVSIFLLHYMVKVGLLLTNKKDALAAYTKATRFIEILVSVAFLITGIWLMYNAAVIGTLMIVKLLFVFASIPLAIIGFKRGNKIMAAIAVFLILGAYGLAEMSVKQKAPKAVDTSAANGEPLAVGKQVYQTACIACHGADGKLGGSGAKDLSVTQLTIDQQKDIIRNGKNAMPGNKELTDDQVMGLIEYIRTLHQ